MTVRVRFAPSPTGYLHIGGARTALFNWMFARKMGGSFILRIEDTDQKRYVEGAIENLMASLRWLGLDWDEGPDVGGAYGPYVQSERLALYQQWAQWLIDQGKAYRCYCSADRLEQLREHQTSKKLPSGYDRHCLHLDSATLAHYRAENRPSVVRFLMPSDGSTTVHDLIRGEMIFPNNSQDDRVLLKSDGFPTYHLANVIDDHLMAITHIMRGEEWIGTAPLHVNLYHAFGWEMPKIAHLPVILSPSGKGKLSKRDQAFQEEGSLVLVKTLDYPAQGYLPEAVVNFLANVGWNFGDDVEKFSMSEAIPRFSIEKITPSASKLPFSKLEWLNGQYIQGMSAELLVQKLAPYLPIWGIELDEQGLALLIPALKPRLKRLTDAEQFLKFADDDAWQLLDSAELTNPNLSLDALCSGVTAALPTLQYQPLTLEMIQAEWTAIGLAHTHNGKAGPFLGALRLGLTGQKVSPPLFECVVALGAERTKARLQQLLDHFLA